jgi:hypothetical protein
MSGNFASVLPGPQARLLADDNHYLHFSQNIGENGWQYNWNDVGGLGGNPTGVVVDLNLPDLLDNDNGLFNMKLVYTPGAAPGAATIGVYLDNVLVATQSSLRRQPPRRWRWGSRLSTISGWF